MDQWHRKDSVKRFIDPQRAEWLTMIDVDCCEYCFLGGCLEPVALIETKLIWSREKSITVTTNLARRANIPAYLVEYQTTMPTAQCEACEQPMAVVDNDIEYFAITGPGAPEDVVKPPDYAEWLWSLRLDHWLTECRNPAAKRMTQWETTP
jgi:hypothetical protein